MFKCIKPSSYKKIVKTHLWYKARNHLVQIEYQNAAKVMHESTLMAKSPDSEDCSSNQAIFGIKNKNKGGTGAL